jgi:predicted AAA+ superfamily ATPase
MHLFHGTVRGVIARSSHLDELHRLLRAFPVVVLVGARQVGKSTLARSVAERLGGPATFFDLENPRDLARLEEPMLALESLRGLVVLDEVQRRPDLFPVLRVLADRPRRPARFLVLGSASGALLRQASESLAGRVAYHELPGFSLDEVGLPSQDRLWLRGGFPRAWSARSDAESFRWRDELVRAYVERDLPAAGSKVSPVAMRRFWMMLAHFHGQTWNAAELARSCGADERTVRGYLDVLTSTFMVRQLQPWHENIGKRQVKSPKVYLADSGLLHTLLGLPTRHDLLGHGKAGASWEGFAIAQVIQRLGASPHECFFWGVHTGGELDLLVVRGDRRLGFEVKLTDAPRLTPSMRTSMETLKLERLDVVHAGTETFSLAERVRAVPLAAAGTWAATRRPGR